MPVDWRRRPRPSWRYRAGRARRVRRSRARARRRRWTMRRRGEKNGSIDGGRRVRHQRHVGLVDGLPAGDRRPVEHRAVARKCLRRSIRLTSNVTCCHLPRTSVKRKSTYLMSLSLIAFSTSAAVFIVERTPWEAVEVGAPYYVRSDRAGPYSSGRRRAKREVIEAEIFAPRGRSVHAARSNADLHRLARPDEAVMPSKQKLECRHSSRPLIVRSGCFSIGRSSQSRRRARRFHVVGIFDAS